MLDMPTNTASSPKKAFARAVDIIAAHKLLGEVLEPMDNGKVKYKNNMTDELVAAKLGAPNLNADVVGRLRRQLFGELGVYGPRQPRTSFEGRLRAIEQRLEALEKLWQ